MKFTCIRIYLLTALTTIERVIDKNTTLPILQNILICAEKGRVITSGTNLEIGIRASLQAKVTEEGLITVPARILINFLQFIEDERVTIETKETKIIIESNKQKTEIKSLEAKNFPIIPELKNGTPYVFSGDSLVSALTSLTFLTATGDIRPELNGIFMAIEKEQLRLAATDSFRLGERVLKIPPQKQTTQCIIPTRTVAEFVRVFSGVSEVQVYLNTNQVLFKTQDKELISRLVEGKYPDYTTIIPPSFTTRVYLKKTEFTQALRAAGVFSGKNHAARLSLFPEKNTCRIESRDSDVGEHTGDISCKGQGGNVVVVGNHQYFLDALGKLEDETISLEGNRETDPLLLKNATKPGTQYLIMPLRSY